MTEGEIREVNLTDYTSKHGGQPVMIRVGVDGKFRATIGEVELESDYLDRIRREIDDTIFGHRIEMPFVSAYGHPGIARGFHAGTREVLVTWENGQKGKLRGSTEVFSPDTPAERFERIRILVKQIEEAQAELEELRSGTVSLQSMLVDAIGEDLFDWGRHRVSVGA